MKIKEIQFQGMQFWPAVFIDSVFNRAFGRIVFLCLNFGTFVLSISCALILAAGYLSRAPGFVGEQFVPIYGRLSSGLPIVAGLFFIFLGFELLVWAFVSFYRSYAYLDLDTISKERNQSDASCTFEAAAFLQQSGSLDPVLALLRTPAGRAAFYRLGLFGKETADFLKSSRGKVALGEIEIVAQNPTTLRNIAEAIAAADKEFAVFLQSRKIKTEEFIGAVGWAEHISNLIRRRKRWWSKDSLGRVPGIGKDWSYGETPTLWKYASRIGATPYYMDAPNVLSSRRGDVEGLEKILTRVRGANAIIVGETTEESMGIIAALGLMINDGLAMPDIEHKEINVLNYEALIAATKDKAYFTAKISSAMAESIRAGNIILVLKDFPSLINSAAAIGADIVNIFDQYLASPRIHVIATANSEAFHSSVENNQALMRHFEKILIKSAGKEAVIQYLMNEALSIEVQTGVTFQYQALHEAAESAERYFFGNDMEDKATDLLVEAATNAKATRSSLVTREDILKLVEVKTGIPLETSASSADTKALLNLEQTLSERIIGQEEGVRAIAAAMRRARSGITNPKRPMGSFLFLGPTGVGKTETTKALADSFFGGEGSIIRLDMSEYRTADALERLIGNFDLGKPGVLTSMLRDKPYGVLLLDEFEKTSKEVLDLFLQVLDEGMFSDMSGRKVSARNLIIIATSNAGSEMIWRLVKERGTESITKDAVVGEVIRQGIFKPELVNRFDGVIVFHPLGRRELAKIAEIMLKKFGKTLEEKGLTIEITPELINALVEKGSDPTFGARPMNRAIQDKVETMVADKILKGEALPGTKIIFTPEEIAAIRS